MIKFVVLCVVSAVVLVFLKQIRPEFALLFKLAVLAFIGITIITALSSVLSATEEIQNLFSQNGVLVKILLKALGLSVTAQLAADICRDCGEQTLAAAVETVAKLSVLLMALPMAKQLVEISLGWLNT